MLIYWLLFGFFAVGAVISPVNRAQVYAGTEAVGQAPDRLPWRPFFIFGAILTIAVVGLRFEVGADWWTYLVILAQNRRFDLLGILQQSEPGYALLNWFALTAGTGIWLVNLVGAAIFGWGLYRFCRIQPSPWLAFAIAIPYMVLVVAMGYTRQSIALGVLMAGLARQTRGASILNFAIYVAFAATFHKTAVIVFPIVAISSRGNRLINILILIFVSYFLYTSFLSDAVQGFVKDYLDTSYDSQGAAVRIAMNLVPAALLWLFKGKLRFNEQEYKVWRNFALAAVGCAVLLVVLSSSTAVDRISLYLMPLQIAVLTRAALLGENRMSGTVGVLIYLFAVQFVWLNFADHARYWVPYHFYPL